MVFGILLIILTAGLFVRSESRANTKALEAAPQKEKPGRPWPCLTPGVEMFTPEPLANGQRFVITLTGTYTYGNSTPKHRADACYGAETSANFTQRHHQLSFDSCEVDEPFDEDRAQHRYSFVYTGTGKRLSILLTPPLWTERIAEVLTLSLRPLLPEEEARLAAPEVARREAAQRQAREKEGQQTRERAERIQTRIQELTHLSEVQPHYADPKYLEDYTRKNKDTLLRRGDEITKKYLAEREVIAYLKVHAPQLVPFATWEMRALTAAEQLDVQQPPAPPIEEKKPERPKLTPEQFTERMVKHFTTKLKDQEGILKAGRAWLEAQEEEILANIEDEDERENVRQHLQAILGEALQTINQNRKGG